MPRDISLLTNILPPIVCLIFVLSQCSCHHLALFGAEKAMVVVCFALTGAPLCPPPPANPPSATTLLPLLKLSFGVPNRSSQSPLTLKSTTSRTISSLIHRPRATPSSDLPYPTGEGVREGNDRSEERRDAFDQWNSWTGKFAGAANVPFLLLQLPQIILNAQNLLAGNKSALFAVPWLGMLTGLLGNLSLLSYFAKKKETQAVLVQTLGVVSTYVVIAQLALADAMPLPQFMSTTIVVASGLVINCLNYFSLLNSAIWSFWEDFTTIGGLSVLSQVMWSTFVPFLPNSIVPGICALIVAVVAVSLARTENLSKEGVAFVGSLSGWTATLLFMWMPVTQMWTNYLNPDNIRGLSAYTMLLAMIGNGLMIPRALFIRDLMWFTGSSWASFLQGWGNLICMYCFNSISREFFSAATLGFIAWLGLTLWKDTKAYGYSSPLRSLKELVFGP